MANSYFVLSFKQVEIDRHRLVKEERDKASKPDQIDNLLRVKPRKTEYNKTGKQNIKEPNFKFITNTQP
jgi:hypothetical protein